MKSIIHKSQVTQPLNKCLAIMMLMSFCLTFVGQAFATPMVCSTSVDETTSPCHQMQTKAKSDDSESNSYQAVSEITDFKKGATHSMLMECCNDTDSTNEASSTMNSDQCACPDGSSATSLSIITGLSNSLRLLSEQPNYNSITGFLSQIESALFRPPIA